ncbi:MAG TPA: protein kinase, partial [Candidatus Dormibacteraeota bacterium]|nr:protein kinase [Candidatus Dormibacteraeota bacterium]
MSLVSGAKLGPYEIVAPLGTGGMGEVYRARDTRLERSVAIKILPAQFSSDPARKQRFEREAKAVSALNHPNICVLHDIGSQDGVDYLVMECVEGETLAKRLEKGPLPLEQVLKYGAQVADALDKAHRAGIVHRDLKPGNIMLTPTGAKLLDFGLAKPAAPVTSEATLTAAVTQDSPVTEKGTIVGTFQYMSPEQIEGKELDGRSDIFSLGAVLYEMLTGKKAFEGKSQLSVASAILEKEPAPITATKPLTPRALEHATKKSLAKVPDERWQSASDLASELKWIAESPMEGAARRIATRPGKLRLVAWASINLVAIALAIVTTYYTTRPSLESALLASVIPPPGVFADTSGRIGPPQISPDGKRLAFIGCKTESAATSMLGKTCSIWLRVLASSEASEVKDTSGAYYPFWSPDSREIAFLAGGRLKKIAADGGPVQVICDAPDARGGSWNSSGTIIFSATRNSPVFRVPAEGGTPVAVTQGKPTSEGGQAVSNRWPQFLPDGKHFLYVHAPNGACSELSELRFASLDGKQDVSVMKTCSNAAFAGGYLVYWRDGNLVAQPIDPHTGVLRGIPSAIVEHASFDPLFSIVEFSVSAEGKLVYIAGDGTLDTQLQWYDRNGKLLGTLGENEHYKGLAISPDGSRVVADTISVKESKILVLDARGTRTLMTINNSFGGYPRWSADGREIYFISNPNGPQDIFVRAADGSGEPREVVRFEKNVLGALFLAVSPDGKSLVYSAIVERPRGGDIYVVALNSDRKPQPFLNTFANETAPEFSPDGRWLAYESNGSGRTEVYITPFPGGGAQYQVYT